MLTASPYNLYCCSVAKMCLTFQDPTDCSTPGFPVPMIHYLLSGETDDVLFVEIRCYELKEKTKKVADIFTCNIFQGPRKTSVHNHVHKLYVHIYGHVYTCANIYTQDGEISHCKGLGILFHVPR